MSSTKINSVEQRTSQDRKPVQLPPIRNKVSLNQQLNVSGGEDVVNKSQDSWGIHTAQEDDQQVRATIDRPATGNRSRPVSINQSKEALLMLQDSAGDKMTIEMQNSRYQDNGNYNFLGAQIQDDKSSTMKGAGKILPMSFDDSNTKDNQNYQNLENEAIADEQEDEVSEFSEDTEEESLFKSGMQKNLYLDEDQDPLTFEKLVRITNIGHADTIGEDDKAMRDLKSATLTYDNRDILTIELDTDQEAFIRSYILDEDVAEQEAHEALKQDGAMSEHSIQSMDQNKRKQYQWSIPISNKVFLKIDTIQQNEDSTKFSVVYNDNGKFYIKVFDKKGNEIVEEFFINEQIGIDERSSGMKICTTPLIVSSQFIPEEEGIEDHLKKNLIFINLYHKKEKCQYHFLFDYGQQMIVKQGKHKFSGSHSTEMNYPVSSFYTKPSKNNQKFYCFYRQGMVVEIDYNDGEIDTGSKDYQLMPRQIDQIFCATLKVDPDNPKSEELQFFICLYNCSVHFYTWNSLKDLVKYQTLQINDDASLELVQLSYTTGDYRFQLIQEKKIKIYKLEMKDGKFRPVLENTMFNFMKCSQLLLSNDGEFAVSFKHDQDNLYVYERKYVHSFEVKVDAQDYEGTIVKTFKNGCFILGNDNLIQIFNQKKQVKYSVNIEHDEEEVNIISMDIDKDEKRLAVALGKVIHGADESITNIIVYEIIHQKDKNGRKFITISELTRTKTAFEAGISIEFEFADSDIEKLIMFSQYAILEFDYMRDQIQIQDGSRRSNISRLYTIEGLKSQPDFVSFNSDQTKAIIGSEDGLIYTVLGSEEKDVNLARLYELEDIKSVIYDESFKAFFILANKKEENNGFYLMSFNEKTHELVEYVCWEHKLPIDDADMSMMTRKWNEEKKDHKHLVCSFKTQYINTYNIFVVNLTTKGIEFWHESYALFEAEMTGFHCADDDFMILDRFGMHLVTLKRDQARPKKIRAEDGNKLKLHSMGALEYLKIRPSNHIRIMDAGEDTIISIQDQYNDRFGKIQFIDLYRVKLCLQSLRELLFIQSLVGSPSEQDVCNLLKEQPSPRLLYESYLELDNRSLVTYLVRQQKAIDYLLGDENRKFFNILYPIFYKNKDGKSAIDIALSNNLVRPISKVIDYIVKYQNSAVFSDLFEHNLLKLLKKSIPVAHVLDSQLFITRIDHAEWPTQSSDNQKLKRPYNGSDIHMEYIYDSVFPDQAKSDAKNISLLDSQVQTKKRKCSQCFKEKKEVNYKIRYTLNRLPNFSTEDRYLMDALDKTDEDDVFRTKAVKDFTEYHWECYGQYPIFFGLLSHLTYITAMIMYIDHRYQQKLEFQQCKNYMLVMLIALTLALIYDFRQFYSKPRRYFKTVANRIDFLNIVIGYVNLYLQFFVGHEELYQKIIFIIVVAISLQKVFNFLRVFQRLSYIVTMLEHVIIELMAFFVFYLVLIIMIAQMMSICESSIADISMDYPKMSYLTQRIINSLRLSLGAFTIGSKGINEMTIGEINTFFVVRILSVYLANMIFMKFIIGEVMKTFNKVRSTIDVQMEKQRISLIKESHDVLGRHTSNKQWFPKFLIIREQET